MNASDHNNFPAVTEGLIGNDLVQTVNARDLHAFLDIGKDFSTWMKDRIRQFGFTENVDFVKFENLRSPKSGSSKSREQRSFEYAISLDMGKELGMVERNEKGREVRQYFIACERRLKDVVSIAGGPITDITAEVRKVLGGMIKSNAGVVIREELEKRILPLSQELESATARIRELEDRVNNPETCSALDIWESYNLPPVRGNTLWLGNQLERAYCVPEFGGRIKIGRKEHRRFDIAKSHAVMKAGLLLKAQKYVEERKGQGNLFKLHQGGKKD